MTEKNQENTRIDKRTNKKKRNKKKLYLYILLPIAVVILAAGSFVVHLYTKAEKTVTNSYEHVGRDNETSELREEAVDPIEDNVSVLIIGVDDSEERDFEEGSRSDALLLATFNKEKHNVKLLSIPRDSYVYVPEVDNYTKITHAHFYGGPKAAIDTVENFLNVPVDYYVRVDFDAFIEVVDSLNGINYNVPFEISEMDSTDKAGAIHLLPGYRELNGEEALALARTRKYDSDIERGKRQQEIIKRIAKKATSFSSILKLDNVIDAVGNNLTTNLEFSDMKSFMAYGMDTDVSITSVNLDGDGGYLDDGYWYYQVDDRSRAEVGNELREHLNLPVKHNANIFKENSNAAGSAHEKNNQERSEGTPY